MVVGAVFWFHLTQSVFKDVFQKSILTHIRQLIIYISNSTGKVDGLLGELTYAKRLLKNVVCDKVPLGFQRAALERKERRVDRLIQSRQYWCVVQICQLWCEKEPGLTKLVKQNQPETEIESPTPPQQSVPRIQHPTGQIGQIGQLSKLGQI